MFQLDNWILVSTSPPQHTQFYVKSDNRNNSAVLVGRKHFPQTSIGVESDSVFHPRRITIKEQKSAPAAGATVTVLPSATIQG